MEAGIKNAIERTVTQNMTARVMGSGTLDVYATPCMIALIEETAHTSVAPYLEEGHATVGTLINVKHVSASPVGACVRCETTLAEVDVRRLVFDVRVYDDAGLIGEGTHERFVIAEERFTAKTEAKVKRD